MGQHRLLCGDSTNRQHIVRLMNGEKADCVFTSPPYGVGVEYDTYQDTIENLRRMLPVLAEMWYGIVADGGFAVVNFCDIVSGSKAANAAEVCEYPMALEYWPAFRSAGWFLWSRRVWCKPCAGTGSMQCISSNRASTNWEHVWTWKKSGPPMFTSQTSGEYPSQSGWFDTSHDHKLTVGLDVHGAGMPVVVAVRGVLWHSRTGGIVVEPFCGTGTTLIAAEQMGRRCYGMEISAQYCDLIVDRWQRFTGRTAERQQVP